MINRFYRTLRSLRRRCEAPAAERRLGGDRRQLADRREDARSGEQMVGRRERERRFSRDRHSAG